MVTFRILSNIETHGYAWAVFSEYKRAKRRGLGDNAARKYAVALVSQLHKV
jgi:hypothetical protein